MRAARLEPGGECGGRLVRERALFLRAAFALLGALGLLALQIVLGLEYTEGGTTGTKASMIGAMVTLVFLPVFFALSRRHRAPSNITLVGLFGGKRSTVSDWLGEWERSGVIPARRTVGRCKAIVPA